MATSLKLNFLDAAGKSLAATFPYATEEASPANVKALMTGMISNGAIYSTAPTEIVSAEFVRTEIIPITLPA